MTGREFPTKLLTGREFPTKLLYLGVCKAFNEQWPIGSDVLIVWDSGAITQVKTTSTATIDIVCGPVVSVIDTDGKKAYTDGKDFVQMMNIIPARIQKGGER